MDGKYLATESSVGMVHIFDVKIGSTFPHNFLWECDINVIRDLYKPKDDKICAWTSAPMTSFLRQSNGNVKVAFSKYLDDFFD